MQVIILSVYDDEDFRSKAMAAGAAAYLVKSDTESAEMLVTLIQNIVRRSRGEDPQVFDGYGKTAT